MTFKVNQAQTKPQVQDIMAQASVYGAAIPLYIGTQLGTPLLIWLNGLTQSGGKKSQKKGNSDYFAQIDLLLGHNPIQACYRCWWNGPAVGSGFNHNKVSFIGSGFTQTFTISDPNFYTIYGVTASFTYSFTTNDYGANGTATLSGTYELPLWNSILQGPDPTNSSGYRWEPYVYYTLPGSPTVTISGQWLVGTTINIYYANIPTSGWGAGSTPLHKVLGLNFENSLGEGNEYSAPQNFSSQQIIYPMYAGVESQAFDLGASGTMPQTKIEVEGGCTLYPFGIASNVSSGTTNAQGSPYCGADADFADMIESILKQGMAQGALLSTGSGTATGQTPQQTGCSSFSFPGTVQKKFFSQDLGHFSGTIQFDLPITKGNILVVTAASGLSGSYSISDTLGNSWTTAINTGGKGFWYTVANASGSCVITLGSAPNTSDVMIFEIGGGDTIDQVTTNTAFGLSFPTGSVTTSQTPKQDAYILTWVFPDLSGTCGSGVYPQWESCILSGTNTHQGGNFYGVGPDNSFTVQRIVNSPGTYTFTGDAATASWVVVMIAVKNGVAPAFPKAFEDMVDETTLNQCRMQCRANGLWGSLLMNSQKKATDWLTEIYEAANTAPVWSGFQLKSIPRSEVSFAGYGALYTAPTASGPVANLGPNDMVGSSGDPIVSIDRKAVTDRPDLIRVQFPDKYNQYRQGTLSQSDVGSLTLYGLRYASPTVFNCITDPAVAQMILGILVRRQTQLINKYKFKLQAKWKLLEAMDLVTITDPLIGLNNWPVRLTSVEEDDQFTLSCEAEDFIYGLNDPTPVPVTSGQGSVPPTQQVPAAVNTPVFLEPPGALSLDPSDELWIGVSDSDVLYGGSAVYISVDGGVTYNLALNLNGGSLVVGSATTGYTTSSWAQALDPDTTNNLPVNLTESNGVLNQFTLSQENQFLDPCYVAGGGGIYPFEIMTYAVATLTSSFNYTLMATGAGNQLRRGVFGTWASATLQNTGPSHPNNSRFLYLDPTGKGIFKMSVPSSWIGKTLWFKFVQYNVYGSGQSTLATATPYSYTILGLPNTGGGGTGGSGGGTGGNVSYTINPTNPLSQTSTTNIHMVNVTATFSPSGLQTFYVARNFTIPVPSVPTAYYVTIFDPNLTGDTGNSATLTSFCTTTLTGSNVGQPGYIYMGFIYAQPSGTGGGGGGGGTNPGGSFLTIPIPATTSGPFQIAHGLGVIPSEVDIKIQTNASNNMGIIGFQSPTAWDATNIYLFASDDGLIGFLVIES